MDNFRDSSGSMVTRVDRSRRWRVDSPVAGHRCGGVDPQPPQRATDRGLRDLSETRPRVQRKE